MANLILFGEIGAEVTAEGVSRAIAQLPTNEDIKIQLNSAGGSLQEAITIFNLLKTSGRRVSVEINGWALSAASLIAMAGDPIAMHENSLLMIHAPWVMGGGNARALRETANALDVAKSTMIKAYTNKGIPQRTVESWLSGEQDYWFTADEAKAIGLIDTVISTTQTADIRNCPFTIPQNILDKMMTEQTNNDNSTSDPNTAAIRAAALRDEARRREDIKHKLRNFLDHKGVGDLIAACLDDMSCTPKMASERLLEHLGKDVVPIQSGYFSTDESYFGAYAMPTYDLRIKNFNAAAADAILMRAGFEVKNPHQAAVSLKGKTIVQLAEDILSMAGKRPLGTNASAVIQAAQTTSDFQHLLGTVTGRALQIGYNTAQATHAVWTGERDVQDFRQQTLIQLSEAPGLEKVKEGDEYTSSYFSEAAESFSIETFGRIVSLTRQALVNDDLNAFTRIPAAFGASARRLEADLVYGKLLGNPTMSDGYSLFHSTHGNLSTINLTISVTGLGEARAAMRKQKGLQGMEYIDPMPRFLIVPVALETEAEELLASLVNPARSNDTQNPEWIRSLTLVADPRLDADSEATWYLAASPVQMDTIIRAYLAGEQRPYVEENAEFVRDVTSFKTRLDVGVGVIDWRGLFKAQTTT